jgi:hypothetical protein
MNQNSNRRAASRSENKKQSAKKPNLQGQMRALQQEIRYVANKTQIPSRRRARNLVPSAVRSVRDTNVAQSAAVAYARGFGQQDPLIERVPGSDSVRIRKRELVTSIATPAAAQSAFNIAATLALNPGIPATFPWLSTQAAGWEQYKFRKLRFDYYTRTATSTVGSIMLVPDYDASDPAPTSEQQAMDYKDAKEEAPWVVEFCCDLTPSALHPSGKKYIRQGAVANTDIKTYDAGTFYVCTTDATTASQNWGKLFVEYDVELSVSQLPQIAFGSAVGTSTTATTTSSLNGMLYLTQSNGIVLQGTGNTLTVTGMIPGFEYVLSWGSTAATAVLTVVSTLSGATIKNNFQGAAGSTVCTFTAVTNSTNFTLAATVANPATSLISVCAIPTAPL